MQTLNRTTVLNTLIEHETLTVVDLAKAENLGVVPGKVHLEFLLQNLVKAGLVEQLDNVTPPTYTITEMGIAEGTRLQEEASLQGRG